MPALQLDLDFVRSHFPALDTPWALFDNAGGSVPARQVIARVTEHLSRLPFQLGASYELSEEASRAVKAGEQAAADLVNADVDEVVLGPSSTVLAQRLASALRPLWSEGDELVVTNLDHETNIGAWRALEATGMKVREWRFRPDTHALELEDLEPLLNERTRLVAFTHCSNLVGTIHDVPRIAAAIRAAGALSCVDGVAYMPHRKVDVRALGCDFYLASLYKVYGPHVGLLFGRREHLLRAKGQSHFFVGEEELPYKLEPGGVCYELVAGLPGIHEYFDALARHHGGPADALGIHGALAEHEAELAAPLLAFLAERRGVRVLGEPDADPARRVPTVSFTVDGMDSAAVPAALDERRVAVRYGHFYAYRAVRDLGLLEQNGVVRASMVHYNTPAEVERLVSALDEVLPR